MSQYSYGFPNSSLENRFEKTLQKIPKDYQIKIMKAVQSLCADPRPEGKKAKKLVGDLTIGSCVAQYRLRVGAYRILYDVDDKAKRVILLELSRRSERTYS